MSYQCYQQKDYMDAKTRCINQQDSYWCSVEHEQDWQANNYIDKRERDNEHRLSIQEIQVRLKSMKATV